MKLLLLLATLITSQSLLADKLSESDRLILIDRLDLLKAKAKSQVLKRFDGAIGAFKAGVESDKAALELYLKCIEKVEFDERDRSGQDFRDWKRNRKKHLSDPNFSLALRHQLRWILLSMQAAAEPTKKGELGEEALVILDAIYRSPKELREHTWLLSQSVTRTVFTRAYGLNGYKIPAWPMAPINRGQGGPVQVDEAFTLLIFPMYQKRRDFDSLRAAWQKRIKYEEIASGFWSENYDEKDQGMSLEREEFLSETKADLTWQMEEYLYEAGDQKRAAMNMLAHLAANISHPNARDWENRFRALVDPQPQVDVPAGS